MAENPLFIPPLKTVGRRVIPHSMFRCVPLFLFLGNAFVILMGVSALLLTNEAIPKWTALRIDLPFASSLMIRICISQPLWLAVVYLPITLAGASFLLLRRIKHCIIALTVLLVVNSALTAIAYASYGTAMNRILFPTGLRKK